MCKFCVSSKGPNYYGVESIIDESVTANGVPLFNVWMSIDDEDKSFYFYVETADEEDIISKDIQISYCPFCGRQLRKEI